MYAEATSGPEGDTLGRASGIGKNTKILQMMRLCTRGRYSGKNPAHDQPPTLPCQEPRL